MNADVRTRRDWKTMPKKKKAVNVVIGLGQTPSLIPPVATDARKRKQKLLSYLRKFLAEECR